MRLIRKAWEKQEEAAEVRDRRHGKRKRKRKNEFHNTTPKTIQSHPFSQFQHQPEELQLPQNDPGGEVKTLQSNNKKV